MSIAKNCLICNKLFRVSPNRMNAKFCSRTCYGISKKGLPSCHKGRSYVDEYGLDRANRISKNISKTLSKPTETKYCLCCGNSFLIKIDSKRKKDFCNHSCSTKYYWRISDNTERKKKIGINSGASRKGMSYSESREQKRIETLTSKYKSGELTHWSKKEPERAKVIFKKISEKLIGRESWNTDLTKETDERVMNYALTFKNSEKGKKQREERSRKGGQATAKRLEEDPVFRSTVSKQTSERFSGSKNPNWTGGLNLPYGPEFNDRLKESVRKRDNYLCQICGMTDEELLMVIGCSLNVHHIDYDKLHNVSTNLISLCKQCHTRTNHNRDYWKELLTNKINEKVTN